MISLVSTGLLILFTINIYMNRYKFYKNYTLQYGGSVIGSRDGKDVSHPSSRNSGDKLQQMVKYQI